MASYDEAKYGYHVHNTYAVNYCLYIVPVNKHVYIYIYKYNVIYSTCIRTLATRPDVT